MDPLGNKRLVDESIKVQLSSSNLDPPNLHSSVQTMLGSVEQLISTGIQNFMPHGILVTGPSVVCTELFKYQMVLVQI